MKAVAVLVLLLVWTAVSHARLDFGQQEQDAEFPTCEDMYHSIAGKCFRFHQSRHSWPAARQVCQREDGDLASVTNEAEYSGLLAHINANYPGTYWTSGHTMNGQWRWAAKNGENAVVNSEWWGRSPSTANNQCAYFCSNTHRYWNKSCSQSLRYICEKRYGGVPDVEAV